LRPALDLLARVPDLPPGDVIDLGCGNGAVGAALAARFPGRRLVGVDNSPAMLAEAAATGDYGDLVQADAARWTPAPAPALIFSNALCHWLPDHRALFARLADFLLPGGVLAVQMPFQTAAPSHALLHQIAARLYPGRFSGAGRGAVVSARDYAAMLAPQGAVSAWETEYVQRLEAVAKGHPVRHFTAATAMRPFLSRISATEAAAFTAAYDAALAAPYPAAADGSVLFPFRRVFFVLQPRG
jgi:trans-aconitate 2-methyltransferase